MAREQELDIEQRKVVHQDKMAAIGGIAAGVLREIGNPIAAIEGVARAMKDAQATGDCRMGEGLCDPDLILRETARLQAVARMIARLAAKPSTQRRLLSLNDLVQTALVLVHFDQHLGGVSVETDLEPQLPAMTGVGADLLQMVMDLLVNAGAAALRSAHGRPLIHVKTVLDSGGARLLISDNGRGMNEDFMRRTVEAPSTTECASPGAQPRFAMCRAIVEQHGGGLRVQSTPGHGTCVTVRLTHTTASA